MQTGQSELLRKAIGLENSKIANHRNGALAPQAVPLPVISTITVTDRRHEIQLLNERLETLAQDNQDLSGRAGNFRSTTCTRQSHGGFVILSDDSSIDVSKAIDLSRT